MSGAGAPRHFPKFQHLVDTCLVTQYTPLEYIAGPDKRSWKFCVRGGRFSSTKKKVSTKIGCPAPVYMAISPKLRIAYPDCSGASSSIWGAGACEQVRRGKSGPKIVAQNAAADLSQRPRSSVPGKTKPKVSRRRLRRPADLRPRARRPGRLDPPRRGPGRAVAGTYPRSAPPGFRRGARCVALR
jgi:hypothetical protein